jgi:hypothetical protein
MANRLDTYALLTLDEGKDALQLGEDLDQIDTLILFINGVSNTIERYVGKQFLSRARTETFDGDGTNRYMPREGRGMTAVATVVYNEDGDEVPEASIKYNARTGEIYLDDGYAFAKGFQNCSVTFTAGASSVPTDIKLAARIILADFWNSDEKQSQTVSAITTEDQTITFAVVDIPPKARVILRSHMRIRIA